MSRKNTVKKFVEGGIYHIYNRGVDRREIFLDDQDYSTFLSLFKRYLEPYSDQTQDKIKPSVKAHQRQMNLDGLVDLLAYCLMPNHFHLLLRQKESHGITQLLRRVCTNYAMYFNKKYSRQGPLFTSIYKAVLIDDEYQLLHVSRYIHLNPVHIRVQKIGPVKTVSASNPAEYPYSSYSYYIHPHKPQWLNNMFILDIISRNKDKKHLSYKDFVEDFSLKSEEIFPESMIDVKLEDEQL